MSAYVNYISPKSMMMDYLNQSGFTGQLNDELIQIFTNRAIDQVLTGDVHAEYVILLDLYNYKAQLPPNFRYPNQVAYRDMEDPLIPTEHIPDFIVKSLESTCKKEVKIDGCQTCEETVCCCVERKWNPIKIDANYITLSKHPHLAMGYSKFMYGNVNSYVNNEDQYRLPEHFENNKFLSDKLKRILTNKHCFSRSRKCPEFQLVRPTSNYFFNLPERLQYCNIPSYDTNLEYMIQDGVISLNNFQTYNCGKCKSCVGDRYSYRANRRYDRNHPSDYQSRGPCEYNYNPKPNGQVLVSYLGRRMDPEGWLMLPDEEYVKQAILYRVMEFMALREYSKNQTQTTRAYWADMKAIADREIIKAKSRLRMPTFDEWEQFVENHWMKSFPYRDYKRNNNTSRPDQYRLPNESYIDQVSDFKRYCSSFYNNNY